MKQKKDKVLIATNRRLQDTAQKLFIAKQELLKKNKELRQARKREALQKKKLEKLEYIAMKRLAEPERKKQPKYFMKKKLTGSVAEGLSLSYINLLESFEQ